MEFETHAEGIRFARDFSHGIYFRIGRFSFIDEEATRSTTPHLL